MNVDPKVLGRCKTSLQYAWLARLEGNYPQAQTYEQEVKQMLQNAGILLPLSQLAKARAI